MSTLIAIGYNDLHKAEEVRLTLRKLQRDYLIDLEDAVVATKDAAGKVKLHQAINLTAAGAVSGGFWGTLIGMLFLNPLLGMAVGASAGAASGAMADVGINDQFMKDLAATMQPNSSVLFVLVRKSTPDKVLAEVQGTGGRILQTSLSHEDEAKLQAALSATKPLTRAPTAGIHLITSQMRTQDIRNRIATATSTVAVTFHRATEAKQALKKAKLHYKAGKKTLKQARKASRKAAKLARKAQQQLDKLHRKMVKARKASPSRKANIKAGTKPNARTRPVVRPATPPQQPTQTSGSPQPE